MKRFGYERDLHKGLTFFKLVAITIYLGYLDIDIRLTSFYSFNDFCMKDKLFPTFSFKFFLGGRLIRFAAILARQTAMWRNIHLLKYNCRGSGTLI